MEEKDRIVSEELLTEEQPAEETNPAEEQGEDAKEEKKPGWGGKKKKDDPKATELKKLQDDYAALNERHMRLLAEYDNFRKRSQRERDLIYPEATAAAVQGLLPVVDNFERALAAECGDPEYKKGAELTYRSMLDALAKLKVEPFGEQGELFDPNCHNAVMHVEDESLEAGRIAEVFQRGYRIGDRVLRPAMVKVAN